jgi:hypothetical protein
MQAATSLTDPIVETVAALRALEMPAHEIRLVATADDPDVVRRHFELHRERLEERLASRIHSLDEIERELVTAARRRLPS